MGSRYVGEIRMFAANFAPQGWALCQGQSLPISEYDTLFDLIGTTYGGDGQETFNLPDLRSRIPIGAGAFLAHIFQLGESPGAEQITLSVYNLPSHAHFVNADGASANSTSPENALPGAPPASSTPTYYVSAPTTPDVIANNAISNGGGSQPMSLVQPILAINFIIALYGSYPSQT